MPYGERTSFPLNNKLLGSRNFISYNSSNKTRLTPEWPYFRLKDLSIIGVTRAYSSLSDHTLNKAQSFSTTPKSFDTIKGTQRAKTKLDLKGTSWNRKVKDWKLLHWPGLLVLKSSLVVKKFEFVPLGWKFRRSFFIFYKRKVVFQALLPLIR